MDGADVQVFEDNVNAAECLSCEWKDGDDVQRELRTRAREHAAANRHQVLMHRTTEYDARPGAER